MTVIILARGATAHQGDGHVTGYPVHVTATGVEIHAGLSAAIELYDALGAEIGRALTEAYDATRGARRG